MILHVACLPFPSHQGTQAAVAAMLRASVEAGRDTHVLTYAQGAYALNAPYKIHRVPDFPKVRSLRSGPSWGKIALDVRCIVELRRLARRLQPGAIVAHHIEAALAALAAGVGPIHYVAHTSLGPELPIYFPGLPARFVSDIGRTAERIVCERAAGVGVVAPSLKSLLGEPVTYLPVPWSAQPPGPTRHEARGALGLPSDAPVCLYAGNLDRYQGWEHLIEALARLRQTHSKARLLIASESDAKPAQQEAAMRGLASAVDFHRLDGELARARVHAASDVAWVPRRTEGGLPIKMLDAFARAVPVVAMDRATAGLPVDKACQIVPNDDPDALAAAAANLIEDSCAAAASREEAFRYLASHHGSSAYATALDAVLGTTAATRPEATRPEPHPLAAPELRAR